MRQFHQVNVQIAQCANLHRKRRPAKAHFVLSCSFCGDAHCTCRAAIVAVKEEKKHLIFSGEKSPPYKLLTVLLVYPKGNRSKRELTSFKSIYRDFVLAKKRGIYY